MGVGKRCEEVYCPEQLTGVCCLPQSCVYTLERYCPGTWLGPDSTCADCYNLIPSAPPFFAQNYAPVEPDPYTIPYTFYQW